MSTGSVETVTRLDIAGSVVVILYIVQHATCSNGHKNHFKRLVGNSLAICSAMYTVVVGNKSLQMSLS